MGNPIKNETFNLLSKSSSSLECLKWLKICIFSDLEPEILNEREKSESYWNYMTSVKVAIATDLYNSVWI